MAYRLGGPAAYRLVEKEDRGWTVPGVEVWRRILQDGPALILLDELAPYLRTLRTSRDYRHMAGAVAPFLKGLLEAVASTPRAACVLTLAEASDAFGEETEEIREALSRLLDELKRISARVERTITPAAGEEEIGAILVHRLLALIEEPLTADRGRGILRVRAGGACRWYAVRESRLEPIETLGHLLEVLERGSEEVSEAEKGQACREVEACALATVSREEEVLRRRLEERRRELEERGRLVLAEGVAIQMAMKNLNSTDAGWHALMGLRYPFTGLARLVGRPDERDVARFVIRYRTGGKRSIFPIQS